MPHFSRSLLAILLLHLCTASSAQVFDAPRHYPWTTAHYVPNVQLLSPCDPLYTPEKIFSLERTQEFFKKGYIQVLHAYPTDGSPSLDRIIDPTISPVDKPWKFFLFAGRPAILYSKSTVDGKYIYFYILTYDPVELTQSTDTVKFGAITFTEYVDHRNINIHMSLSDDGESLAICFSDPVDESTKQWSPGCWVFEQKTGALVWGGYFKTPVYRPYNKWFGVQNDGSVIVDLYAKPAGAADANGKSYPFANSDAEKNGRWFQVLRLSDQGMDHWDGWLPDGRVLVNGDVASTNGAPVIGGVLNKLNKEDRSEWFLGTLNERLEVVETARGQIEMEDRDDAAGAVLEVADDGTVALVTGSEESWLLSVLNANGDRLWNTSWPKDDSGTGLFWYGKRLYQPFWGEASDVKAILEGKKVKGPSPKKTPIYKSWDLSGKLSVDLPLPEKEGGKRDLVYMGKADLYSPARTGHFVDIDHGNGMKGVVAVPFRKE
jgi:hypothetical protein